MLKDTSASALQKKRSSQKFFRRSPQKNVFQKIFQALHKILTIQKILLSSSRGQANFRGLDLRGQGIQNVSSRTPPLLEYINFYNGNQALIHKNLATVTIQYSAINTVSFLIKVHTELKLSHSQTKVYRL